MSLAAMRTGYEVVQELRLSLDMLLPINYAGVFFYIASNPGCTQKQVEEEMGLAQTALSRIVAVLSETPPKQGKGGYGVIKLVQDYNDRRVNRLELTEKGRLLSQRLTDILGNGN